jgi:hypothetical protein
MAMMLAQSARRYYNGSMRTIQAGRRYFATHQLRTRILEQGRSFRWVAQQIELSDSHFNRVLSGERWVTEANARMVAAILGTDFDVLWKVPTGTEMAPKGVLVA